MNLTLPGPSGRQTTRLGYGCSRLMGSIGRPESSALLEAAYEAGIRHFDVAPAYGGGQAEACVGEFLVRHRAEVTVATKYGVPVHDRPGLKLALRRFAMPVIEKVPGLKQRLQRAVAVPGKPGPRESLPFTAALMQASVETSLKLLRTDHIDLFLLHEVMADDLAEDANADRILRLLEGYVAAGTIGAFGCASSQPRLAEILSQRPQFCTVVQHEWSVLDPLQAPEPFRILHRSLSEHFLQLHTALLGDKAVAARWSATCGADVANAETLAQLMLKASLVANPGSVVLFSSKKPAHIKANIALLHDAAREEQATRFYALVRAEAGAILPGLRA